jgi:hypothetical protein
VFDCTKKGPRGPFFVARVPAKALPDRLGSLGHRPADSTLKRAVYPVPPGARTRLQAADFNVAHLMVDNVDTLHGVCQRAGLRIIKNLKNKDYGLRAFVFEGPDGNRIDVDQSI